MELNLPWALIDASQRRWVAEKMNMGQAYREGPKRPSYIVYIVYGMWCIAYAMWYTGYSHSVWFRPTAGAQESIWSILCGI